MIQRLLLLRKVDVLRSDPSVKGYRNMEDLKGLLIYEI